METLPAEVIRGEEPGLIEALRIRTDTAGWKALSAAKGHGLIEVRPFRKWRLLRRGYPR